MESNEAFEVGTEAETLNRSTSRQNKIQKGPDAFTAAYGSTDPPFRHRGERREYKDNGERQPLLESDGEGPQDGKDPVSIWAGDRDFEGLPWWHTPSVWWLLPPFVLFTMAFGGTIVIKINIILGLICRKHLCERAGKNGDYSLLPVMVGSENPQCQIPEVQALVSKFTLYGALISGILSAIIAPKLGALSDRYGRTRLIAASASCMLISEVLFIFVARMPDMVSVNYILLGYFFDGLGGSFTAVMAISYAYGSDCTPPERRNVVFGYYQGCLFGGIALGPLFGAYIMKATGDMLSIFYIALASHLFFSLWLMFIVPESLTMDRQLAARRQGKPTESDAESPQGGLSRTLRSIKQTMKTSNILAPLSILWPVEPGTNPAVRRNLVAIAAVDTTCFGVAMGAMTVILIYAEFMFGWGSFETNVYLSTVSTCRVVILLVILPLTTRIMRGPREHSLQKASGCDQIDLTIIRLALVFDMLGYVGFALVRSGPLFIASGAIASIGSMGSPTLQSALTKHVPPDRTGQVLGAMGLLHAVARVVAPIIFNLMYAATVGKFTQTVFVSLAATWGLAFVLSMFIKPHVYWNEKYSPPSHEPESATD